MLSMLTASASLLLVVLAIQLIGECVYGCNERFNQLLSGMLNKVCGTNCGSNPDEYMIAKPITRPVRKAVVGRPAGLQSVSGGRHSRRSAISRRQRYATYTEAA